MYPQWLLDGFNSVLSDTGLSDLELYGHQFTWEKGRDTPLWLEIRLDRAMANNTWFDLFPLTKLFNIDGSLSDHSPIFLEPRCGSKMQGRKRFRFENAWLMEPLCKQIVKKNWEGDNIDILQKIKQCCESLDTWGREIT